MTGMRVRVTRGNRVAMVDVAELSDHEITCYIRSKMRIGNYRSGWLWFIYLVRWIRDKRVDALHRELLAAMTRANGTPGGVGLVEQLLMDKARLDWLERNGHWIADQAGSERVPGSFRDLIDLAMARGIDRVGVATEGRS